MDLNAIKKKYSWGDLNDGAQIVFHPDFTLLKTVCANKHQRGGCE
jgi:hypothetical protein